MSTDEFSSVAPAPEPEQDLIAAEEAQRAAAYRVLNPLAVVSLVLGVLSLLTFLTWYLAVIPIAGIVTAVIARRQLRRAPDEVTGMPAANAGFVLSIALWILGVIILTTTHSRPPGYTEISFDTLQPNFDAHEILPAKASDLHEKRVYITGYMYPGRQSVRIKQFILVPTQGHCKFCASSITPTEMVNIKFVGDVMADFTTSRVGIGGKLKVDKSPGFRDADGYPYTIEADYLEQ